MTECPPKLRSAAAVSVASILVAACGAGAVSSRPAAHVPRPQIVSKLIPFGAKRRAEMAAYAKRHYGIDSYKLTNPHVIVEHWTATPSFTATYDTFAPDVPDVELHELPGVCSHFVIASRPSTPSFASMISKPLPAKAIRTCWRTVAESSITRIFLSNSHLLNWRPRAAF